MEFNTTFEPPEPLGDLSDEEVWLKAWVQFSGTLDHPQERLTPDYTPHAVKKADECLHYFKERFRDA